MANNPPITWDTMTKERIEGESRAFINDVVFDDPIQPLNWTPQEKAKWKTKLAEFYGRFFTPTQPPDEVDLIIDAIQAIDQSQARVRETIQQIQDAKTQRAIMEQLRLESGMNNCDWKATRDPRLPAYGKKLDIDERSKFRGGNAQILREFLNQRVLRGPSKHLGGHRKPKPRNKKQRR